MASVAVSLDLARADSLRSAIRDASTGSGKIAIRWRVPRHRVDLWHLERTD
jgi:hypothetical protein